MSILLVTEYVLKLVFALFIAICLFQTMYSACEIYEGFNGFKYGPALFFIQYMYTLLFTTTLYVTKRLCS